MDLSFYLVNLPDDMEDFLYYDFKEKIKKYLNISLSDKSMLCLYKIYKVCTIISNQIPKKNKYISFFFNDEETIRDVHDVLKAMEFMKVKIIQSEKGMTYSGIMIIDIEEFIDNFVKRSSEIIKLSNIIFD